MLFLGISLFGLSVSGTLATAWLPLSALLLGTGIWWLQYPGKEPAEAEHSEEPPAESSAALPATPLLVQQAAEQLDEALMLFDIATARFTYVSSGYHKLWQRDPAALLENSRDWLAGLSVTERWQLLRTLCHHRHDKLPYRIEFSLRAGTHQHKWVQMRFYPEQDEQGNNHRLVILADDITEIRYQEERLRFEANHDALTGLPNHKLLKERLARWLDTPPANGMSLFVLDVDHLKHINDVYGHAAGDQVLREFAERSVPPFRPTPCSRA